MRLAVCYYPEHWPKAWWAEDARQMLEMGIELVRIAEFAWSRIEPSPGQWEWAWLDEAVAVLSAAGLKVVMCTPTATPPKWLVDADPAMLAVDAAGAVRGFGSRRHYCFSSLTYREQAARVTLAIAQRYGHHPAVVAWQTDNEFGCHNTVLSYSVAARAGFRRWLQRRYGHIAALNQAWGAVVWGQEYRHFEEVDAPVGTVTEANPAHRLDYQRFASSEVRSFNRIQVDILRAHSPGRDVSHNFMGFFTDFDHHEVAEDLDVVGWDSYPLGFTQDFFLGAEDKIRYARTGHPDIPAFHHDLYRGMTRDKRWWVMEQQPGPVNWAKWNPAPADGMVRLWTWQAFAHGAEVVSYFRWRQAPFAQEQMHSGLRRRDRSLDQGGIEATQVGRELRQLGWRGHLRAAVPACRVALVFDYPSVWMSQIQPQGTDFKALELSFLAYSALRQLGWDVDIVSSQADVSSYALIVLPAHLREDAGLVTRLAQSTAQVVLGPRCGSKTESFEIPAKLPPGCFSDWAGVRVLRVASLPPGLTDRVTWTAPNSQEALGTVVTRWREDVQLTQAQAIAHFDDGRAAVTQCNRVTYVAGWLDAIGWQNVLLAAALRAGLSAQRLPRDVRISQLGDTTWVFNFSNSAVTFTPEGVTQCLLEGGLGTGVLPPYGVSIWHR